MKVMELEGGIVVIAPKGILVQGPATDSFCYELAGACNGPEVRHILLDLTDVMHINAAVQEIIAEARRSCLQRGATLTLAGLNKRLVPTMLVAHPDLVLNAHLDLDVAVQVLRVGHQPAPAPSFNEL